MPIRKMFEKVNRLKKLKGLKEEFSNTPNPLELEQKLRGNEGAEGRQGLTGSEGKQGERGFSGIPGKDGKDGKAPSKEELEKIIEPIVKKISDKQPRIAVGGSGSIEVNGIKVRRMQFTGATVTPRGAGVNVAIAADTDTGITELTGDVTAGPGSDSQAATIPDNTVTYAKMQNISATDMVLGRSTAGAGDPEEITCTAAGRALLDDATAAAQLVTLGVTSTAAELNILDGATLDVTELNYVDGVTSAIQTQIDGKSATGHTHTLATGATDVTASAAELNFVDGVTSAIQTQMDLKAPIASPTFTGTVTVPVGLTGVLRADTGVVAVDSDVTDIVTAASLTLAGKVELATIAETDTGTDATRAVTPDGLQGSKRNIRWLVFNLVEAGTDVAVATNIAGDFVSPIAGVIQQSDTTPFYLYATNSTAGTTGTMVVDISIGGTSIMTTNKLDFDSTEKTTTTAATPPDLTTTALAVGDIITIDVDSLHTTAAKGLTVYMAVLES